MKARQLSSKYGTKIFSPGPTFDTVSSYGTIRLVRVPDSRRGPHQLAAIGGFGNNWVTTASPRYRDYYSSGRGCRRPGVSAAPTSTDPRWDLPPLQFPRRMPSSTPTGQARVHFERAGHKLDDGLLRQKALSVGARSSLVLFSSLESTSPAGSQRPSARPAADRWMVS